MKKLSRCHISRLGYKAEDIVSGFSGTIIMISFYLYGCIQAVVSPPMGEDGKKPNLKWFDVTRLKITYDTPVLEVDSFKDIEGSLGRLGFEATDVVTDFKGVVSSIGFGLDGSIEFSLTPRSKGDLEESDWFAIQRIKVISSKAAMTAPDYDTGYVAEGKKGAANKRLPNC